MKVNNAVFSDFYHPKCVRKLVSKVPIFVNPKAKLFWNFKMEFQVQNVFRKEISETSLFEVPWTPTVGFQKMSRDPRVGVPRRMSRDPTQGSFFFRVPETPALG